MRRGRNCAFKSKRRSSKRNLVQLKLSMIPHPRKQRIRVTSGNPLVTRLIELTNSQIRHWSSVACSCSRMALTWQKILPATAVLLQMSTGVPIPSPSLVKTRISLRKQSNDSINLNIFTFGLFLSFRINSQNRPGLPFVYMQTMLRLDDALQDKLVTDIEALKPFFPATVSNAPSVFGKGESERRNSVSASTFHGSITLGEGVDGDGARSNRVPLTKESLDLMDAPIPCGMLASEFAYHGLAPTHLKEMHEARDLLDQIYTQIKKYDPPGPCRLVETLK